MPRHSSFRRVSFRQALCGAPLVAVLAIAAGQAAAQDAPATQLPAVDASATAWRSWMPVDGFVAPTTTTGTKTDTPLIEQPQSVSVVTRDQMDAQGAQTISQALRFTAGVLPEVRPSPRFDSVFVRGFGGQGTGAAFVNFLDGLRMGRGVNFAVPNVNPWMLERIEVLRGPASVLYGQTSSGGIVNLVTRRPTETPTGDVRLELSSHERLQAAFDFGGPLTGDGTVLYRLTGIGSTGNTQYDFTREDRIAFAPAITWKPSADTTLTVLAGYQYDPEAGFYNFVPAAGTVLPSPHGGIGSSFFGGDPNFQRESKTQYSLGYQFEHRFDSVWTVRQNARYMRINSDRDVISVRSVAADGRTATRAATRAREQADTFAIDNQVQASFSTGAFSHTLLAGLDWAHTDARSNLGTGAAPALDLFNPIYYRNIAIPALNRTTQNTDQVGLYLQDQVAFDRLRLNFGLRYDWAESETTTHANNRTASQSDDKLTWRVGALYLFDNGIAPYATYSTSFLPNSGTMAPQRGGGTFDPTEGELYEVGVKYQPRGMNSFVQVSAYQITQTNVLTRDPDYNNFSVTTGEIRSRGIEVEGRASLDSNLDLILTYAYTDAEITQSNNPGVEGNRVPQVPHHMASAWVDYRFTGGALRGLGLGAGIRYVGKTYGDEANSFTVDAATLFDAAIRYNLGTVDPRLEGLQLTLNASNLADKEYVASCSSTNACYFGSRRFVTAGLRYSW